MIYGNGKKYLERLKLNNKEYIELYRNQIIHLREELKERAELLERSLCALEILGEILKDDRKILKEIKVCVSISKTPSQKIELAAPFLILYFRKEIEKILSNKLKFKGRPIRNDLSKSKQKILKEWMSKPVIQEIRRRLLDFYVSNLNLESLNSF